MKKQFRLYIAAYCIARYELSGLVLSDDSVMNITNFVLNDPELKKMSKRIGQELFNDDHFVSSYFEFNDIELAECIQSDLSEPK